MEKRATFAVCLLTILALSWSTTFAQASSISYSIHDEKVAVELSLQFFQNVTKMPTLSQTFTGAAAANLAAAIQTSLRELSSEAMVSSLSGELKSTGDWINATIHFDVSGVATRNGALLNVNCSWIRLKVPNNLALGDVNYNLIGTTYIKPAFEKYSNFQKAPLNETITTVGYRVGTQDVTPDFAIQKAGNTTLLDFGALSPRVDEWNMAYNLTQGVTTWIHETVPSTELEIMIAPRDEKSYHLDAYYAYNAKISVDGFARANADTITIDTSGGYESLLMLVVVITIFLIALSVSWKYRSRRKQLPRRRK